MCACVCPTRWLQHSAHRHIPPVRESRVFVPSQTCSHGQGRSRRRPVPLAHDSVHRKDGLWGPRANPPPLLPGGGDRKGTGTPGNGVFFYSISCPVDRFSCFAPGFAWGQGHLSGPRPTETLRPSNPRAPPTVPARLPEPGLRAFVFGPYRVVRH